MYQKPGYPACTFGTPQSFRLAESLSTRLQMSSLSKRKNKKRVTQDLHMSLSKLLKNSRQRGIEHPPYHRSVGGNVRQTRLRWSGKKKREKQRGREGEREYDGESNREKERRVGVPERAGPTLRAASPVHPEDSVVVRQRRTEERPVEARCSSLDSVSLSTLSVPPLVGRTHARCHCSVRCGAVRCGAVRATDGYE